MCSYIIEVIKGVGKIDKMRELHYLFFTTSFLLIKQEHKYTIIFIIKLT